jgi:hypothetical protein
MLVCCVANLSNIFFSELLEVFVRMLKGHSHVYMRQNTVSETKGATCVGPLPCAHEIALQSKFFCACGEASKQASKLTEILPHRS